VLVLLAIEALDLPQSANEVMLVSPIPFRDVEGCASIFV
jgi:hypothetical protein